MQHIISGVREQMLEYFLWRAEQYTTYDEFKNALKDELKNLHDKNMKILKKVIDE